MFDGKRITMLQGFLISDDQDKLTQNLLGVVNNTNNFYETVKKAALGKKIYTSDVITAVGRFHGIMGFRYYYKRYC